MDRRRSLSGSGNGGNIKKLLKLNGVTKFPSGMKFSDTKAEWNRRHGHAGSNTIRNMCIQLDHAGWKRGDWTTGGIPDGSVVSNSRKYTSPDGQIVMSYYEHFGVTAYENFYSITFELVGEPIVSEGDVSDKTMENYGEQLKYAWDRFEEIINQPHIDDYVIRHKGRMGIAWDSLLPNDDPYHRNHELYDAICQYLSDDTVVVRPGSNEWLVSFPDMVNEARFKPKGLGKVEYEDDVVVVYTPTGKEEYKGIFDYCPYRYDHMEYDDKSKSYRVIGDDGNYRIMVKVG